MSDLLINADLYDHRAEEEPTEEMARPGRELLCAILAECTELSVSDIQFRTDRLIYAEDHRGMFLLDHYGEMDANALLAILHELCYFKEKTNPAHIGEKELLSAYEETLTQLREKRVADFSTRTIPLDDEGHASGRLRVQAHFSNSGLGITCRLLNPRIPELEELGFAPDTIRTLQSAVLRRAGLCLVTGPTGSGKSTTLASLIDWVRRQQRKHIVTIEDPVEYLYPHDIDGPGGERLPSPGIITQQEVGRDVESFRQGLKDVLRKAPHVILLGEIRNRESMETCLEAAQTGHLVLTTLHTTGSVRTVGRILELFPRDKHEAVLHRLSETLVFILSQGLLNSRNGRALTYEFLHNQDDACASAVASYWRGSGALQEVITRAGNIEWDASLERLLGQGLIDEETFVNNRMRREDNAHGI